MSCIDWPGAIRSSSSNSHQNAAMDSPISAIMFCSSYDVECVCFDIAKAGGR